jgi:methionyl-tRNA formyltransferase
LIATIRPWNVRQFERWAKTTSHTSQLVTRPEDLTIERIESFRPDYLFLPHWSWIVPPEVFTKVETIAFHMAELPYARGGSPLQNQMARGIEHTQLCALRVEQRIDAGPVYLRRPLCLQGSAEEIYIRASALAFEMIEEILDTRPQPVAQEGEPTVFKRRTPAESEIPTGLALGQLFDFIRMLDADGYPRAFLDHGDMRFTFSRVALRDGRLHADVEIVPKGSDDDDPGSRSTPR